MKKKSKYYKKISIPVRIIKKIDKTGYLRKNAKKAGYLGLLSILILVQIQGLSAFEAHIINITARICRHSETRTMGYWKNHEEVYLPYILLSDIYLGNEYITEEKVDEVFDNANADVMAFMLRGQLLAMKFNIAHFGIGGYFIESEGKTINDIVGEADDLLILGGVGLRSEMEEIKNILDYLNNLHQIRYCSDGGMEINFSSFSLPQDIIPEPEPESIIDITTPSDNGVLVPEEILGCLDSSALNYNPEATVDDESCEYEILGCMDSGALNYNPDANTDNGLCEYSLGEEEEEEEEEIAGCIDPEALNYNLDATIDDESCEYSQPLTDIEGCTDSEAENYNPDATIDNSSCQYPEPQSDIEGCTDSTGTNYNAEATIDDGTCTYPELELGIEGCMDSEALNYNVEATTDDGTCQYEILGCTDPVALNYNSEANTGDGTCEYAIQGCTDSVALNYNIDATVDDGSCEYPEPDMEGCTDLEALNYNPEATLDNGTCIYPEPEPEPEPEV